MSEPGNMQEPPPAGPPPGGYQQPPAGGPIPGADKKVLAGVLAIILGSLGIHKFILGYKNAGFIMLGVTVVGWVTACIGIGVFIAGAMQVIGIVEGIMYLTKSDQDFVNTYIIGKKEWF